MVRLGPNDKTEFKDFLTSEECEHLAYIIQRDEHKILSIPHFRQGNDYSGLTAKHTVYNIFNHADIRPLRIPERLFDLPLFKPSKEIWYDELWCQAWANCLHQGENINLHCHETVDKDNPYMHHTHGEGKQLFAMSIYIDGHDPNYTHWDGTPQRNERGTLHVAGKYLQHEVKTNIHTQPRISIAMDVYWKYDSIMDNRIEDLYMGKKEYSHKRFLHVKRPTHISTEHQRIALGRPNTTRDGHGKQPLTDKYGFNVGSKDWYESK